MSEPAVFVFIRGGSKKIFADRWAGSLLYRELVWGPEALESWATNFELTPEDDLDACPSVTVNFDEKTLGWKADNDAFEVPAVLDIYDKLLKTSWPGFEIDHKSPPIGQHDDDDEDEFDYRPETVKEAARDYDDEGEDGDDEPIFDESEVRAWLTLIDKKGTARHRMLEQLSQDLFKPDAHLAKRISLLPPAEIPAENVVREGFWIDIPKRKIGIWGNENLRQKFETLVAKWKGWNVVWENQGYKAQCEGTGAQGVPLDEAKALATFIPQTLSTKRMDMDTFISAIGGGLKKRAIQLTGCLIFIICLPLVAFGFFSNNWTAVGWSILVTIVVIVGLFKLIEFRIKRKVNKSLPKAKQDDSNAPPVAGPLDTAERESRLEQILSAANFPSLSQLRPHFNDDELELLGLN